MPHVQRKTKLREAALLAKNRQRALAHLDFDGALTELDKAAANPARDNNGQMDGFPFVQLRQSDGYNSRPMLRSFLNLLGQSLCRKKIFF